MNANYIYDTAIILIKNITYKVKNEYSIQNHDIVTQIMPEKQ